MFGALEDGHRYTRLVELFAQDAVYYDPFFGPQVGIDAIGEFMAHMEKVVPASGATFANWRVDAGITCGFAEWLMVARNADGVEVAVPGESLYRLRDDGLILGVADYVDPVAYARLRGADARDADLLGAGGALPEPRTPAGGVMTELVERLHGLDRAGRWPGDVEVVDAAGDGSVGWAQWTFHGEHGDFAGWTLRRSNGATRDFFDTVGASLLAGEGVR